MATFEEIKDRVARSTWLPKWLRDWFETAAEPEAEDPKTIPIVSQEDIDANGLRPGEKWCPFGAQVILDKHNRVPELEKLTGSYNRVGSIVRGPNGFVTSRKLGASKCVRGACMVYDAENDRCGMMFPAPQIQQAVGLAKAAAEEAFKYQEGVIGGSESQSPSS